MNQALILLNNLVDQTCQWEGIVPKARKNQALVVLVGITANKIKREAAFNYLSKNTSFDVFLPNLPQYLGMFLCARLVKRYLVRSVEIQKYSKVHFLNYISGGMTFRLVTSDWPIRNLGHVVYVRGPIQEQVPNALIRHYGKFVLWVLQGQMVFDLAHGWLQRLPYPVPTGEQGLVIETGTSQLAHSLGVTRDQIPKDDWDPQKLFPGVQEVIKVPLSHDEVYTSSECLGPICKFFETGSFETLTP